MTFRALICLFRGLSVFAGKSHRGASVKTPRHWNSGLLSGLAWTALFIALTTEPSRAADIYWTNLTGGSWSTAANWNTGSAPGPGDHAFIISNGTYTVSTDADASVANLTVGGSEGTQTVSLASGTLAPGNALNVIGTGRLRLDGGGIRGGILSVSNEIVVASGVLNGVTVNGNIDVGNTAPNTSLTVTNGLLLNGTLRLGHPVNQWYGYVDFHGSQSLSGNATVEFGNFLSGGLRGNSLRLPLPDTTLTLAGTVTLSGGIGALAYTSLFGGPTNVRLVNAGLIVVAPSTLNTNGPDLSGKIIGGTITTTNDACLMASGELALDGVTVNGDIDVGNLIPNTSLAVTNGLVLNGTLRLGHPTVQWAGWVDFHGSQSLSGNPVVEFGAYSFSGFRCNALRLPLPDTTLTLSGVVTFKGRVGALGYGHCSGGPTNVHVVNQGTIVMEPSPLNANSPDLAGKIEGGTINLIDGARLVANDALALDGVTVNGDIDVGNVVPNRSLAVTNGLVLNGVLRVGHPSNEWSGHVDFHGSQSLSGNAAVEFGINNSGGFRCNSLRLALPNTSLTIGSAVTIHGLRGSIGYSPCLGGPTNVAVINGGTIISDNVGGAISITGQGNQFSESGRLVMEGGDVLLMGKVDNVNRVIQVEGTAGEFRIAGGTIIGGTVSVDGTPIFVGSDGTLDGVTVNGDIDVGNLVPNTSLAVTNGLVLNGTLRVGNPTNQWSGSVDFHGSQSLSGNATVEFGFYNSGGFRCNSLRLVQPNTTLTLPPTLTVQGYNGTIGYTPCLGGSANVTVVNEATIVADRVGGGILFSAERLQFNSPGRLVTQGGNIILSGRVDNTNRVIQVEGTAGEIRMPGSIIAGGTIAINGAAVFIASDGTFDGVTVNGNIDVGNVVPNTSLAVTNGLTLNGTLRLGHPTIQWYGSVDFHGSQSLKGNATVEFGAYNSSGFRCNSLHLVLPNTTLTFDGFIVIKGGFGTLGDSPCQGSPANIHTVNQGTLVIAPSPQRPMGPDLTGTIKGGTINTIGGASLIANGALGLDGVTVNGNIDVGNLAPNTSLRVTNGLVLNGTLQIGHLTNQWYGSVDFHGSQTLSGRPIIKFGVFNSGGFRCNALRLALPETTLTFNGVTEFHGGIGSLGKNDCLGNPPDVHVVNQGTFVMAPSVQKPMGPDLIGKIEGGTINTVGGARLIGNEALTLDGVIVNGDIDVGNLAPNTWLNVTNGLVLNGTLQVGHLTNQWYGSVDFHGSQTLSGNVTVKFGVFNSGGFRCNSLRPVLPDTTLTFNGVMEFQGGVGSLGHNACLGIPSNVRVVNQGTFIVAPSIERPMGPDLGGKIKGGTMSTVDGALLIANGALALDGVTVNGDIDVGNIVPYTSLVVTNGLALNGTMHLGSTAFDRIGDVDFQGSQTLSGNGTVIFGNFPGGGMCNSLRLSQPGTVLTLGPGITVRGLYGSIGYATCYGVPANLGIVNQGTIKSELPGGVILVQGQAITNQGVALFGNGGQLLLAGSVWNSGQLLGLSPGFLNVSGDFTQTAGGKLGLAIGGMIPGGEHGRLQVSGTAHLGGTLAVFLTNGFLAQVGNQFTVLTSGSRSGTFATLAGDSRFFAPQYGADNLVLAAENPVAPEILGQPQDQHVPASSNATFTVLANGTPPLSYQWFFNATNLLTGATSASWMITNVSFTNMGAYHVVVSNAQGTAVSVSASLTVDCVNAPAGLVAWWPGSGTEHDVVGGHQGTVTGSIPYLPGQVGTGLNFDGIGFDFIETAATPDLSPHAGTSGEMSLEAWVLVRTLPVNEVVRVVHKVDASLGWEYQLMVDRSGQAHFAMSSANGASGFTATGGVLSPSTWHHLAGTYRYGQFIRLYVDGQLVNEIQNPALVTATTPAPFVIGGSPYFNGMLDEVMLFNRALTSHEIAVLYASGSAGMCSNSPPAIVSQPLSQTAAAGTNVTLSAVASGLPTPGYQWFFNNHLIAGANSSSLLLLNVDVARTGSYHVVASNAHGTATSEIATVTVLQPPSITLQPLSQTVLAGQNVSFVANASGSLPLGFLWYRNGLPFATEIIYFPSSMISLPNIQTFDSANFQVVVTNFANPAGVVSDIATLTVLAPVGIVAQPTNATVVPGGSATFCVSASGSATIQYQWRHNGAIIPGATNACLVLTNVQLSDGGAYQVSMENPAGTSSSASAFLTFQVPDAPPGDNFADRVSLGTNVSGTVRGTNQFATKELDEPDHAGKPGEASVWYRWTAPSNGVATFRTVGSAFDTLLAVYTGTNVSTLAPIASDEDDGGFFTSLLQFNATAGTDYAIVLDGFGGEEGEFVLNWNLESTGALLPVITVQPTSRTVSFGSGTTLNVTATGNGLRYQWYFNGAPLAFQTNNALSIASVLPTNVGNYFAVVTNNAGRAVRSDTAVLEIGPVPTVQSQDKFEDLFLNAGGGGGGGAGFSPVSSAGFISVSIGTTTAPQIINNTGSSTQSGEADHCVVISTATRWLRYRAENAGVMVIDTLGSAIPTVLEAYTDVGVFGFPVNSLACGKTNAPDARSSRVSFATMAGKEYYVAADGLRGAAGLIVMNAALGQSPILPATTPTNAVLTATESLLLSAPAPLNSTTQLRYQWQLNGRDIRDATNATYFINTADSAAGGSYSVIVINEFGTVARTVAVVGVTIPYLRAEPQLSNGRLRLSVQRPPEQTLVIEGTGNLGSWTPLQTVPLTIPGPTLDLPLTNTLRFFRARPWP